MASTSNISELLLESSASENEGEVCDVETHLPLDPESKEEDNCEEMIENSDSEESVEEASDCEREIIISVPSIEGKNGHRWGCHMPTRRGRPVADNIVTHLPHSFTKLTNEFGINALFGLLYAAGTLKGSKVNVDELWSDFFGIDIFRAIMSLKHFQFLCCCLRFDEKSTRIDRRLTNKLAPIRGTWETFISSCKQYYSPHEYLTIDEQLVGFWGRCPFKVYMPNKPAKYGMKIVMMNDSKTYYMLSAEPCVGTVQKQNNESVPEYYVRKLSERVHGTKRNLTYDNWFSSIPTAERMLKEYKLTTLGTLRKNKKEIPPIFVTNKAMGTALFAFDKEKTLLSFAPRNNKIVLLLSTMHRDDSVDKDSGKPEMIMTYNMTKGGTDTFDKLRNTYTVARGTNRWPLRFRFAIMDHAAINAMILFVMANPEWKNNPRNTRREFLKTLAEQLCRQHLEGRLRVPGMQEHVKARICQVLGKDASSTDTTHMTPALEGTKRKRCHLCPYAKDKKTRFTCSKCTKPYCLEHRGQLCANCVE
ncbi:piggyBac transposable element-derived protein 4-like [Periplaneta americana]|uniref:piggyBac transposable element-derived protein 4-like n=1 Tax=Periplaneta americana TaxID=6978 RepID=UPI0037E88342